MDAEPSRRRSLYTHIPREMQGMKARLMGVRVVVIMVVSTGAVVVVRVAVDDIGPWWIRAAVRRDAGCDLQLDGRVVDAEVIAQLVVEALKYGFTLRQWHLVHLHMAGQRVRLRGEAPDVEIVYVDDDNDLLNGPAQRVQVDGTR